MMERYFAQKFREKGRYIIGKWWDRKGENEIDLVVVDPIDKQAWVYELKKQGSRYRKSALQDKVNRMLEQTPELGKMAIHIGALTVDDM